VTAYRWGLIPHWAENRRIGSRMFNARSETLARSPAFRDALERRRCVVPVDSFYEWRREGSVRQPFRVVHIDGRPLALAGLWAGWRDPETDMIVRSFSIVTGEPIDLIRPIHDRMPVVLSEDRWPLWLDPDADPAELQGLLQPDPTLELIAYPVSRLVNDVRRDGPELIEPLAG
jgi:putative SOS response-associated peptidase YedK